MEINSNLLPNGWLEVLTADTFSQISTGTKKVKTKDCKAVGKFPVIDQGQADIAGFVDDESKVINVVKPLVIFGDHTRAIKWIIKDFVPGADGTKVLEAANFLEPKYFYYQLRSLELPDKGYARHFRYLNETSFKVAPLAEQQQIAAKLDELLAQVDNLKTRLDTISKILKRFRQSVLAAAVSGKLTEDWRAINGSSNTEVQIQQIIADRQKHLSNKKKPVDHLVNEEYEIPTQWEWVSLDALSAKIVDGTHHTPKYVKHGVPFISVKDIKNGKIDFSNTKFISVEEHIELCKRCKPEKGDLLITKSGTIGRTSIVKTDVEFSLFVSVALIKPSSDLVNINFIDLSLRKWVNEIDVSSRIVGSAIKNLHLVDMRVLAIPFPPIEEQAEIVARVEQLFTYADQIEQRVKAAQARVNHLTQAILAKAFSGELTADWRAQNPELISGDNSAAALLARIKTERETVAKPKKTGKKTQA